MTSDEILNETGRIIREAVQCGPVVITRATKAMDVRGWDSLTHTILLMRIEEGFNITLPIERVFTLTTVGDLVDLIAELLASPNSLKP